MENVIDLHAPRQPSALRLMLDLAAVAHRLDLIAQDAAELDLELGWKRELLDDLLTAMRALHHACDVTTVSLELGSASAH